MTIATTGRVCRVCRIVYDDGTAVEVALTPALERWIARLDDAERKREARHRGRETTFTDAGVDAHKAVPFRSPRARGGYPPEGPYYPISHLIGESRIWPGPRLEDVAPLMAERLNHDFDDPWSRVERPGYPEPCEFCHGGWLKSGELCLRCTASGYDGDPKMRPSRADLARRIESPRRDDGLRGGR